MGRMACVVAGTNPGFLVQQNSMRDAILASLNLNIFARHANRVRMANIAQMINVLQAMILTDKEKMVLTPTYYVFKMYGPSRTRRSFRSLLAPARIRTATQPATRGRSRGKGRIGQALARSHEPGSREAG